MRGKHDMTHSRIYTAWSNMKSRCKKHPRYAGKGITVCKKWESFEGFYEDMKDGYAENLTLDRINNEKGYSKENCRWITLAAQADNRKYVHRYPYKGQMRTISEIAKDLGVGRENLYKRLVIRKWPIERAITQPTH